MTATPALTPEDDALCAEYVLGVLPHAERRDFALRLQLDPALAARVRFWDAHFHGLTDEVAEVSPPARVLRGIEGRLFAERPASGGLWFWRALSGLSVAALVAVTFLYVTVPAPGPVYVAEVAGEAGIRYLLQFDPETARLRLSRTDGAPAEGRALELWLIAGDNAPVSLGVLPTPQTAELRLPADLAPLFEGGVLAVSDEPPGGSPTGAPTGAVLATGAVTGL